MTSWFTYDFGYSWPYTWGHLIVATVGAAVAVVALWRGRSVLAVAFGGLTVLVGSVVFLAWLWPGGAADRRARRVVTAAWAVSVVARRSNMNPGCSPAAWKRVPATRHAAPTRPAISGLKVARWL